MSNETKHFYEFGPYRIDPAKRMLLKNNQPLALTPKAFETLLILVRSSGRVLEKEELMKTLWPDTFVEDGNLAQNIFTLRKALGETPTDRYIITVPGRGYRFAVDVKELSDQTSDLVIERHSQSTVIIEEKRIHRGVPLALLGMVVVLSVAGYLILRGSRIEVPRAGMAARRSVAVLGFKNLSGHPETSWLSVAVSEMLSTELAAGEKLRLIPGEDVARMKADMPLTDADSLSKDTLARIRRNLGTDLVVVGAYTDLADQAGRRMRLDLRLQDTVSGETILAVAETGTESNLFELVTQAGVQLRERLGLGQVSTVEAAATRAAAPSTSEATRFYAEGLFKLRMFDALAARDLLLKAVAAEPAYPLSHAALSAAWSGLGYDGEARHEAKKAFDLSISLSRDERLSIEGLYRETLHEWDRATEIYRTLYQSFPDNLDYGLRLAGAQTSGGKAREALATVDTLRHLPIPVSEDVRIELAAAHAFHDLSEFNQEQTTATKAAEKGKLQGARLQVARALQEQGIALEHLGKRRDASAAFEEAKKAFSVAGNQNGVAHSLNSLATIADWQGDYSTAERLYKEAESISKQIGNHFGVATALNNLSQLLTEQGDLAGSAKLCRQSLAIYRKIGDRLDSAASLSNCAGALQGLGDLPAAKRMFEESLKIAGEVGNRDSMALQTYNIGAVLTEQGDLSGGGRMLEQARGTWQANGDRASLAYALYGLGEVALARGDLASARKLHEQALSIRRELAEKVSTAESQLSLATVAYEEGHPDIALKDARATAEAFHANKVPDDEAAAHLLAAEVFLLQGRTADAGKVVKQASALASKSQNPRVRLTTAIMEARLEATAHGGQRVKNLDSAVSEAKRLGLVSIEFEGRLAQGEIELRSANAAAGRERLAALEREARAAEFGLIAAKANSVLRVSSN
jgi:DNA-binding winged helix-turn-helix (wHTH) protein/tetratricopeptide (TPR) repeat protein/TolB-like protein